MKKIIIASISVFLVSSSLFATVNANECKACHGQNFEKAALGRSDIVANMTHGDIAVSLTDYKTTTTKDELVMKNVVSKYSDKELKDFAQTIGKKGKETFLHKISHFFN